MLLRRKRKIERILNHRVEGEGFINPPSRRWKRLVLMNFNRVYRKELTVEQLLELLKSNGVEFDQKDSLVIYPVEECLKYIAKVSKIDDFVI